MSDDIDPAAIQRQIKRRAAASDCTGITASPAAAVPPPPPAADGIHLPGVPLLRRLPVLGIGLLLGAAFSLFVAGPLMPSEMRFADRVLVWASVMGGPIVGTAWGLAEFHPFIGLGWLGLLLSPAHPIRPSLATGCVTGIGLLLWFFAGFLAMIVAVWGA